MIAEQIWVWCLGFGVPGHGRLEVMFELVWGFEIQGLALDLGLRFRV